MKLQKLWEEPPSLHKALHNPGEDTINWGFTKDLLEWLEKNVVQDMTTLETGSGLSTIVFAGNGAKHTAIDPTPGLPDRIKAYAEDVGVSMDYITFLNVESEFMLPQMVGKRATVKERFDLIVLDGSHTFPTPFIDWFYMSMMLKTGGLMLVDDAWKLPVCRFLMDWMLRIPEFEGVERIGRAHIFKKVKPVTHPDRFMDDRLFKVHFKEDEK